MEWNYSDHREPLVSRRVGLQLSLLVSVLPDPMPWTGIPATRLGTALNLREAPATTLWRSCLEFN